MISNKKAFVYTLLVGILYSYTSSIYLGNYYRIIDLLNAESAEFIMMRMGYFLQALGMLLYSFLFRKYNSIVNTNSFSIIIVSTSVLPMFIVQNTTSIPLIVTFSFIFNVLVGIIIAMYLTLLAHNVKNNNLGLCYGIAYAFGSLFTFLFTYFDDGLFMESPSMTFVYIVMATISCIILLGDNSIKPKESIETDGSAKKLFIYLTIFIIGGSIVTGLGDGIYSFGVWKSGADIRITKIFYAASLVIAGYLSDKSRRLSAALTATFLSYYIISAFLLNNAISSFTMMSLGYFFMSFLSVYRYMMIVDVTKKYPQYYGCEGYGLMISRIAEGLTSLLMMLFPLSLTNHVIVTLLFYAPLVIITIVIDNLLFSNKIQPNENGFVNLCEKYNLTSREQEICKMILENATDDEIACKLYISKSTVRFHISNILKKTNCSNRVKIKNLYNK